MEQKNCLRICLYAGPGAGKSTLAAGVFYRLKLLNLSVELINEYIKSWAYENKKPELFDQVYIFAKQQRLEDRVLRAGVTTTVSDSPLFLQCYYAQTYKALGNEELVSIAKKFDTVYPSLNLFIKRHKGEYNPHGRFQSYEEALVVDEEIKQFLNQHSIPYLFCENDPEDVVVSVLHKLKAMKIK